MSNRIAVKAVLLAGLAAVVGLNVINRVTDFQALSPDIHPVVFEIEAIVLSAYEAALLTFYLLAKRE